MKQSFVIYTFFTLLETLETKFKRSLLFAVLTWLKEVTLHSLLFRRFVGLGFEGKEGFLNIWQYRIIATVNRMYLLFSRWVRGSKCCSFFLSTTSQNLRYIYALILFCLGSGIYLYLFSPYYLFAKILGGIAFLVITLRSIKTGLYILLFFMPLISFTSTIGLSFLIALSFMIQYLWQRKFYLPENPLKLPFILFACVIFIAALTSVIPGESVKQFIYYGTAFVISIVILFNIKNQKDLNEFIYILTVSVFVVALYGIYQYFIGVDTGHGWVDVKLNPGIKTRVYSTLENPNILAEYIVLILPLSVAGLWNERNKLRQLLYIMMIGIITLCLVFTFSRGGWVGFALALMIFIAIREPKLLFPLAIIGLIGLFLAPDVILNRLSTIGSFKDSSNAYRLSVWQASMLMIQHYGLTGVGLGYAASLYTYPEFMLPGIKAAHAHNIFLQLTIELGIMGIFIFLWLIMKLYQIALQIIVIGRNRCAVTIAIAFMGALTGHLFHGLVEYIWFHPKIVFTFWMTVAILLVAYNLKGQPLQPGENDC